MRIFWSENATRPVSIERSDIQFQRVRVLGGVWNGYLLTDNPGVSELVENAIGSWNGVLSEITPDELKARTGLSVNGWTPPPPPSKNKLPKNPIWCVLAYSLGDLPAAKLLLEWMITLGKTDRTVLLTVDRRVNKEQRGMIRRLALKAFADVSEITTPFTLMEEKWPKGPNWMFQCAAGFMEDANAPWYWCEPDCVPLKCGWLETIEREHIARERPFMGVIVESTFGTNKTPEVRHLTGCAVYPPDIRKYVPELFGPLERAWDVELAGKILKHTAHTKILEHQWGEWQKPPTFTHLDQLKKIPKQAVLFHRCKDGSLIRLLREARRRR